MTSLNDPSQIPPAPVPAPSTLAEHLAALHPQQAAALRGIMAAQTYAEIGHAIGVNPRTIGYWRTSDPQFIAAVNAWHVETIANARNSLWEAARRFAAAHPEEVRRHRLKKSESQSKKRQRSKE